jgi:HEAT repeat protein
MVFLGPWSDGQARIDVIDALRETRKKSAIPHIIASLTDPEQAVSTYGMNYLRGFTGPATYYYPVREAAAKALKEMTGQDFGADQQQWTNWWRNTAQ